jgi:hypothetical protein
MSFPYADPTYPDNLYQRSVSPVGAIAAYDAINQKFPLGFPVTLFQQQLTHYAHYRNWLNGAILAVPGAGAPHLYPLQLNFVTNFISKHVGVLLGDAADSYYQPIRSRARPRPKIGAKITEESRDIAKAITSILDEVWILSDGNGVQQMLAFDAVQMGGGVLKVSWKPWDVAYSARIPIKIQNVMPEAFVPVWNPSDLNDIIQCYEVYRITGDIALQEYGVNAKGATAIYCETWDKETYSILIDGKPARVKMPNGETVVFDKLPNPWGRVPYFYFPAHRENGIFYGKSIIPQMEGILREYNSRMADAGDLVQDNSRKERYIRDVSNKNLGQVVVDKSAGIKAVDLGTTNPISKNPPEIITVNPSSFSSAIADFASEDLWATMMRAGEVSSVAFGEDEGGQKSGMTLAFRMWPMTNRASITRRAWTGQLNLLSELIIKMVAVKWDVVSEHFDVDRITVDTLKTVLIYQDWRPMIPRDKKEAVDTGILQVQAGQMSTDRFIDMMGEVEDKESEKKLIRDDMKFRASLDLKIGADGDNENKGVGYGANTEMPQPNTGREHEDTG